VKVYLGKDRQCTACDSNPYDSDKTDEEIEGHGHKLYKDSLFSSPELFGDLAKK